jgi:hypothetical protein
MVRICRNHYRSSDSEREYLRQLTGPPIGADDWEIAATAPYPFADKVVPYLRRVYVLNLDQIPAISLRHNAGRRPGPGLQASARLYLAPSRI